MTEIPLFPLSSVLYPEGVLPMQIFEVRYLSLIKQCLATQTGFGVVGLLGGNEIRKPEEQIQMADYGTYARIEQCEIVSPVLFKIRCIGEKRFKIHNTWQAADGLWMGEVQWLDNDPAVNVPDDLLACSMALSKLLESLEQQDIPPAEWPVQKPYKTEDCGWLANRWCELLPLDIDTKLQLLALGNPLLRLELINDTLQAEGMS